MKALIVLSHGSRRRESNREMIALAEKMAAVANQPFAHVSCAFQQFAPPAFEETIADLVARGATQVVVLPLFLAAGNHVLVDVPEMINKARLQHPTITISLAPHLGKTPELASFLMVQAIRHS